LGENLITPPGTKTTSGTGVQAEDEVQEVVDKGYNEDAMHMTMVELDMKKEAIVEETKQSPLD